MTLRVMFQVREQFTNLEKVMTVKTTSNMTQRQDEKERDRNHIRLGGKKGHYDRR